MCCGGNFRSKALRQRASHDVTALSTTSVSRRAANVSGMLAVRYSHGFESSVDLAAAHAAYGVKPLIFKYYFTLHCSVL